MPQCLLVAIKTSHRLIKKNTLRNVLKQLDFHDMHLWHSDEIPDYFKAFHMIQPLK